MCLEHLLVGYEIYTVAVKRIRRRSEYFVAGYTKLERQDGNAEIPATCVLLLLMYLLK